MPRIHSQPQLTGKRSPLHEFLQFLGSSSACGVGVGAGVEFDKVSPQRCCRTNLRFLWIDE